LAVLLGKGFLVSGALRMLILSKGKFSEAIKFQNEQLLTN